MASLSVEGLLSALGWKYAQGSDKAIPFADSFDLLGVRLEVDALSLGRVSLENKPGSKTFGDCRGDKTSRDADEERGPNLARPA